MTSLQASHRRSSLLSKLIEWLKNAQTHPQIVNFVTLGLSQWFSDHLHQWDSSSDIFSSCNEINSALTSQLQIGWYYFLCGFLSSDLVNLQSTYFHSINSTQSSLRWSANFIKQLWLFLHELWIARNESLHQSESIHKLTRIILLKNSISSEYALGLDRLPTNYSSYFHLPLQTLLNKSSSFLKRWFLVVRSGRECQPTFHSSDIFSINGPIRQWVKLKPI